MTCVQQYVNIIHDGKAISVIDTTNGFINATEICRSANKLWHNFSKSQKAKRLIDAVAKITNKNHNDVVICKVGGDHSGTWVHPIIATNLATWCSDDFGVKVSLWIEEAKQDIQKIKKEWEHEICNLKPMINDEEVKERLVKERLARQLEGEVEVPCSHGNIDIVTKTEIIEVKVAKHYKHAIGQILVYGDEFVNYKKRIHLFCDDKSKLGEIIMKALPICNKYNIILTYEVFTNHEDTNTIVLSECTPSITSTTSMTLTKEQTPPTTEPVPPLEGIIHIDRHPIVVFLERFCEFGEDVPTNRYRVIMKDLYDTYLKHYKTDFDNYPPICEKEFNTYLKHEYKLESKPVNWNYAAYPSWINIRLKLLPTTLIQTLTKSFVDHHCLVGEHYIEDTKLLFDAFEKYALDRGYETIKQNGFSRQNFRTQLLNGYDTIKVVEWAIYGKKHGYAGIKLKTSINLVDVVDEFIEKKCVKGKGFRIANVELWDALEKYVEEKTYDVYRTREGVYKLVRERNPELVVKHVGQNKKGFVGLALLQDTSTNTQG